MKRIISTLTIILLSIGFVVAADLTIQADKQTFKDKENKASFDGNVKVILDDIVIVSPNANAILNPKTKKIDTANFLNNAHAYQIKNNKKNEVKANIIKISLINKVISAEGNTNTKISDKGTMLPIITINADKQEYNTNTKLMTASGNVISTYKDTKTFSEKATVQMDVNNEIQELQLIGNAKINHKDGHKIMANKFVYKAKTEDFLALGAAYSEMLNDDGSLIKVWANTQQFNKKSNILSASNNVKIIYKDYYANGPHATVLPDKNTNKLNKIVFSGRSKINNNGRTIEADKIVMTMNPKDFSAEGNVKTYIPNVKGMENN